MFKKGQKLLHLTTLGGQPHMRIVTVDREGDTHCGYDGVWVEEFDGFVLHADLYTKEYILSMFTEGPQPPDADLVVM